MKRQSPLVTGVIYFAFGIVLTYLAINQVSRNGWNFFAYIIVFLATIDFGSGIRLIMYHVRLKRMKKK